MDQELIEKSNEAWTAYRAARRNGADRATQRDLKKKAWTAYRLAFGLTGD